MKKVASPTWTMPPIMRKKAGKSDLDHAALQALQELLAATTQCANTHCAREQQSDARRFRHFTNSIWRHFRQSCDWRSSHWRSGFWSSNRQSGFWSGCDRCLNLNGGGRGTDNFTLDGPAGQGACVRADAFSLSCAGGDEQGGNDEVTNLHGGSFLLG